MDNLNEVEILLVEDNPRDAEMTLRALKRHNLTNNVHWVKDGAEAIDFLFATGSYADRNIFRKPKVILLDLKLPKVSGIEVLKQIKADERTRVIPVAVLTSSKEDQDLDECYQHGVNSYIVKPVEFESFVKAVADLGLYWLLLNQPPR
jgi:two-component system response regulator